jgi:hypothetical protein
MLRIARVGEVPEARLTIDGSVTVQLGDRHDSDPGIQSEMMRASDEFTERPVLPPHFVPIPTNWA